ncbi:hypothetical protein [Streptomyces atratus]|uniref:hypothetical protein n=1 Tax=Streptomyces atratus TaxID=1893 RepID=UPI001300A44B|nr:hypothetical protein [Streptomyces atratus]
MPTCSAANDGPSSTAGGRGRRSDGRLPLVTDSLERSRRKDAAATERIADAVARRVVESATHEPEPAIPAAPAAIEKCAPPWAVQQALRTALGVSCLLAVVRGCGIRPPISTTCSDGPAPGYSGG